jgi:hypothetical protein
MNLRIDDVLKLLQSLQLLLDKYRGWNLDDMISDLILKSQGHSRRKGKANTRAVDVNSIVRKLYRLKQSEQINAELEKLDKPSLLAVAKLVDVRVDKKQSKAALGKVLSGHLGFRDLNRQIAERSDREHRDD